MKIALALTAVTTCPPEDSLIWGPQWTLYYLANGLVERGHDVTLYAAPGSNSKARIKIFKSGKQKVSQTDLGEEAVTHCFIDDALHAKIFRDIKSEKYDIIHSHYPRRACHMASLLPKIPVVLTEHTTIENHPSIDLLKTYNNSTNLFFTALSRFQAKTMPQIKFSAIVPGCVDTEKFSFKEQPDDYLLWVGRIVKGKGLHLAIKIAKKTKKHLKIIGPIEDKIYWEKEINPQIKKGNIDFLGLVPYGQLPKIYQKAKALLYVPEGKETFGNILIEAMSCGTPVVALNKNAVKEIVLNKKTGFIVNDEKSIIEAIKRIDTIKRIDCRKHIEKNFSIEEMINKYEEVYKKILEK